MQMADKEYMLVNADGSDVVDTSQREGSGSLTHRRHTHFVTREEKEHMKHFESLDFCELDNVIYRHYRNSQTKRNHLLKTLGKWIIAFLIGVGVGLIVYTIKMTVEKIQDTKFSLVEPYLRGHREFVAFLIYYSINLFLGLMACLVVIICGPVVSSSGIPEVKGYLNGIRIRKAFNIKTLIGKVISLIFSFSSGLALGPEGPMFHIGSALGAAMSQFRSKTFNIYSNYFWRFQNDVDKRDFISCGAAAGIAAAFGAPIGGVLFTMEEGSSFWSRTLTWRTFFACLIATFTANLFLQNFQLFIHDYGVLTFGLSASGNLYSYPELIPFLLIGIFGGLIGALFVHVNVRINKLRKQYLGTKPLHRLAEVAILITITTAISFGVPFLFPCRISEFKDSTAEDVPKPEIVQFTCPDDQYNDFASLFYAKPDSGLRLLYNRYPNIFNEVTLPIFALLYFCLATMTSGVYMASGIFIPMMFVGASLGRFIGFIVGLVVPSYNIDSSVYGVVGSAALMAGSLRLTISLVVIIVELTEGTQYLLPIILVVMVGKWVGDLFNESIYEHLIELKHIPYLPFHPAHHCEKLLVRDVMTRNVITIPPLIQVREALKLLRVCQHNAFPVVMDVNLRDSIKVEMNGKHEFNPRASGKINLDGELHHEEFNPRASQQEFNPRASAIFKREAIAYVGMITRNQLVVLLQKHMYGPLDSFPAPELHPSELSYESSLMSHEDFAIALSRTLPEATNVTVLEGDNDQYLDLRPYINMSNITISKWHSFTDAYNIFRSLGLRHLVAVDEKNAVTGILTRKDFL